MIHCTVCGAAAREGAKFCTSCGARLVDTTSAPPEATDTAPPTEETAVAEAMPADTAWAPSGPDETENEPEAPAEPAGPEPAIAEEQPAGEAVPLDYAANWPAPEATETRDEPVLEEHAESGEPVEATGETTWSSWSSATTEPEAEATEPVTSEMPEEPATAPVEPEDTDTGVEEHPHGASQWESWAPEASGAAAVPSSAGDTAAAVRRLLDDLTARVDRLIPAAALASGEVDADALATQLERWSRATPDSADLLEVVRAARKAPRDLDAVTRLADRAADLELLVRHYRSITDSAGQWARELRQQDASGEDA